MITELISLPIMAEVLRANINWKSPFLKGVGHFGPKFQVEGGDPTNDSMCPKNYMNLPFIRYKNLGGTFVRFVTIHACDGQTDGRTDGRTDRQTSLRSERPLCIQCSAVKTTY